MVEIKLKNLDGQEIGERIITDGVTHLLLSPFARAGRKEISTQTLKSILKYHSDISYAELGIVLIVEKKK